MQLPIERRVAHRPDWLPVEPVNAVMVNPRVTSGPGQASVPTGVADASEVIGKMWPARQQKMFKKNPRQPEVSRCDFAGTVAVDATLSAVLAGDVAVGVTSPAGLAGNAPPDVVFLADAEVASSADRVGVASSADCAEVWPLAVTEVVSPAVAEVASSADFAQAASSPLLRWRPRPTPWVLLTHMTCSEWVMMTVVWLCRVVE